MAQRYLPKLSKYIPLWQRNIPQYQLWWKGNPQLRIFMPMFWMKLVKSKDDIPDDMVHFKVHPQMTRYDIKNYLEKIYNVPVLNVRTHMIPGEEIKHRTQGYLLDKKREEKVAYVQIDGQKFDFPDIFYKSTPQGKEMDQFKKLQQDRDIETQETWQQRDIPIWFR